MAFPYVKVIIGFKILMYMFETYLNVRQYTTQKPRTLPECLVGVINKEKFVKSRAYSLGKSQFNFVHLFVTIVLDSGILYFRMLPWLWEKSGEFLLYAGLNSENEIWHTLAFLGCIKIWSEFTKLPLSLYAIFMVGAHHGVIKKTIRSFFKDKLKDIAVDILFGLPIIVAIIVITQTGAPYLTIYFWSFTLVIPIMTQFIYPVLIAPFFNKFTRLPHGELRKEIEKIAVSMKFPLEKLYVVDQSTSSSSCNAYIYGLFFNERIVLYDTLLQQCQSEEIVAVFAHEVGHWKFNHTTYKLIILEIRMFMLIAGYCLIRNLKALFESFGFHDTQPVFISLVIFQHAILQPLEHIVRFAVNLIARSFEFQADAHAKKLGYAKELRKFLIKIQEDNMDTMNPDPWYSAYYYNHPPLVQRLAALEKPG